MEWVGADPNAQIISEEKVSNYFTYSDLKDPNGKTTIKARACRKIVYKNIYPNIDIEYIFPENKSGIKYSIILHPGANPDAVQMRYSGSEKLQTDAEGDLNITSLFGVLTDHAPLTYFKEGGDKIKSQFVLRDNIVSFNLGTTISDAGKTIIIDPWMTIPVFTGNNKAYDIDWDYQGNVYIHGGQGPFQLSKLNSAGVIQWTFLCSALASSYYGDFAIDRNTGTAYLCQGFGSGYLLKVNTLGNQLASARVQIM